MAEFVYLWFKQIFRSIFRHRAEIRGWNCSTLRDNINGNYRCLKHLF